MILGHFSQVMQSDAMAWHEVSFDKNNFTRLDGNGISINRYARNVSITNNEFVWIGDSAITQWGDTTGVSFPNSPNDTTTMGYDGTEGNQPRGTYIGYNFVHELGIWEKQSSFYFQAKSCQNQVCYTVLYCFLYTYVCFLTNNKLHNKTNKKACSKYFYEWSSCRN